MNREPTYRQALRHGWDFLWEQKLVWVFGLFAAVLGQMGVMDFFLKAFFAQKNYRFYSLWFNSGTALKSFFSAFGEIATTVDVWVWLVWLLVIIAGMGALLVFFSIASHGMLIHATAQSVTKKRIHISKAWQAGVTHFWRLFFLQGLKAVGIGLIGIGIGLTTLYSTNASSFFGHTVFIVIFILAVTTGTILSLLVTYAAGYVVTEEYPFWQSVRAAWRLFVAHWVVSLEVAGIVLLVNVATVALAFIGFVLFVFERSLFFILSLVTASQFVGALGLTIISLFLIGFLMFLGALLTVFTTSVWIYLFMKMHKHGLKSRLLSLFWRK